MESVENSSVKWNENRQAQVIATTTFMCAFTAFGLFGNCLLIGCLLKNRTERWKVSRLLMTNLCFMNILDCVVNMSLMISTSLAQSWTHSEQICQFQAFTLQMMNSQITLGLTSLSVDRFVAVKESENYCDILSVKKTLCIIGYCWFQTLSLCIPIITDLIPSNFYSSKYLCSVGVRAPLIYVIFVCLLCFIVPLLILLGVYGYIFRIAILQKSKESVQQRNPYSDMAIAFSSKTKELHQSKFTVFMCLLWLFLCAPYLLVNFYELIRNSSEILESNSQLLIFAVPEGLDTALTWVRCSFPAVFAVTNLCRKEFRNNAKTLFTCRRNNSVIDLNSASKTRSLDRNVKPKLLFSVSRPREKQVTPSKDSPGTPATFQVPVLFATSNGIHLHKFDNEQDISSKDIYYRKTSAESRGIPVDSATKCDVLGSQSDLIQVEDDTSDYDSSNEVDRFSVSNPVSMKRPENVISDGMHRSLSNPEVGCIRRNTVRPFGETCCGKPCSVLPSDSGIDISSSAGNSMSRNKNWSKGMISPNETAEHVTDISLPSAVNSLSGVVLTHTAGSSSCNSLHTHQDSPLKPELSFTSYVDCTASRVRDENTAPRVGDENTSPMFRDDKTPKQDANNKHSMPLKHVDDFVSICAYSELPSEHADACINHKHVKNVNSSSETNAEFCRVKPPRLQPIQYCVSPARKKPKHSRSQAKTKPEDRTKNVDICTHGDSLKDIPIHSTSTIFSPALKSDVFPTSLNEYDWSKQDESLRSGAKMKQKSKLSLHGTKSPISQTLPCTLDGLDILENTEMIIARTNKNSFSSDDRNPPYVSNKTTSKKKMGPRSPKMTCMDSDVRADLTL